MADELPNWKSLSGWMQMGLEQHPLHSKADESAIMKEKGYTSANTLWSVSLNAICVCRICTDKCQTASKVQTTQNIFSD